MTPRVTVALLAAATLAALFFTDSAGGFEGFEPVGTCWKDVRGSFEVKRILWAAQTLAWRVVGHLLTRHPDSPYTKDLLRKSKLEFRLPSTVDDGNANNDDGAVVSFDETTGCLDLNLDHPAVHRLPDGVMKKKAADATPQDTARTLAYAANVAKAVVHALASVHGKVGTAAHDKAYNFYASVIVDEMAGPRHLRMPLVTGKGKTTKPPVTGKDTPRRCSAVAKSPAKFAECCAAKALRDETDDVCSQPFTF